MPRTKKDPAGIAPSFTTAGFIITQDGKPCTIANVSGMRKGGLAIPGTPVAMFLKKRDARRAASRTARCVAALRGSMIEEWARQNCPALFAGGKFEIEPLGRQG